MGTVLVQRVKATCKLCRWTTARMFAADAGVYEVSQALIEEHRADKPDCKGGGHTIRIDEP